MRRLLTEKIKKSFTKEEIVLIFKKAIDRCETDHLLNINDSWINITTTFHIDKFCSKVLTLSIRHIDKGQPPYISMSSSNILTVEKTKFHLEEIEYMRLRRYSEYKKEETQLMLKNDFESNDLNSVKFFLEL